MSLYISLQLESDDAAKLLELTERDEAQGKSPGESETIRRCIRRAWDARKFARRTDAR